MHRTLKPARWLVLLAALAMVIAACAPDDADEEAVDDDPDEVDVDDDDVDEPDEDVDAGEGGTIVWAYEQEPGVLNSLISDGNLYATSQIVLTTMLAPYIVTPDFEYIESPLLESGEVTSEEDPFTVTLELAEEADWSDGEPITAGDVFFTAEMQLDEDATITSRAGWEDLDMEATEEALDPDSKTIELIYTQPYAAWQDMLANASSIILPEHVLGDVSGEDFNTTWADGIWDPETEEPIASGPFIFESFDRGQQVEVVRNEDYYGEAANLDRIVFRFIPDIDTQVQQLRGGEIDMMDPQVQLDLFQQIEEIDGATLQTESGPTWEHVDFQHTNPLIAEQWMREAIVSAIEREQFIEEFIAPIEPAAEPLNSIMYVTNQEQYEDHFGEHITYDPDNAESILEENCGEQDDDGVWICDGERAEFEWVSTAGNERRELFFEFAQAQLNEVGIQLNSGLGDPATVFSDDVLVAGEWDMFEFAWVGSPDPESNVNLWGCFDEDGNGAVPDDPLDPESVDEVRGDQNYHRYCPDPETSDLLRSTRQMLDEDERTAAMNEVGADLAEALPIFPLYQLPDILVHSDDFTGLEINTTQAGQVWNVAEWAQVAD